MDMQDFEAGDLYFDEPLTGEVQRCLASAAEQYSDAAAEHSLMRAYFLEPEHPVVLVALYRYFYYQHRLEEALMVAERVIGVFARRLKLPENWRDINEMCIGGGVMISMVLIRFYLLALKAAGYLELRLGNYDSAIERLGKVAEIDSRDRLGARSLLNIARDVLGERTQRSRIGAS